nr:Tmn25 [Streptomyces sp.]
MVPMPTSSRPHSRDGGLPRGGTPAAAPAAPLEHYAPLARLAYLTLPPALGRHRRVLTAHTAAQRALPAARERRRLRVPAQRAAAVREPETDVGLDELRVRVLRSALRHAGAARRVPGWLQSGRGLPVVLGLRMATAAGGADELSVERSLARLSAPERAAFALLTVEGLDPARTRDLLERAGVREPGAALRRAEGVAAAVPEAEALLRSGEFDPTAVQLRPTDLVRRRRRRRVAAALAAAVVVGAVGAGSAILPGDGGGQGGAGAAGAAGVPAALLDPGRLVQAPPEAWADTARVDFTAWPARGGLTGDDALLGRALSAWAAPAPDVGLTGTPGTSAAPPAAPPRLLYAGEVSGAAVVLLYEGERLVRYAESADGSDAPPALDIARVDDADVTTAAAVAVSRGRDGVRYLLAPWVDETATRDLLRPDEPARDLGVADDGVTDPVPASPAEGCDAWPALRLRSSARIVEDHSFLVTDLGDLTPVHLTYTPPPGEGAPARQPREATSGTALAGWARSACRLDGWRGEGVRAVNNWVFAQQELPEDAGRADWVCSRAGTWRGPGRVLVQLQPPARSAATPGRVVAAESDGEDSAACSRFGRHVLASTDWRAPSGRWYLLAAGSRDVRGIEATGDVEATAAGPTLAKRADKGVRARVTGRIEGGGSLATGR